MASIVDRMEQAYGRLNDAFISQARELDKAFGTRQFLKQPMDKELEAFSILPEWHARNHDPAYWTDMATQRGLVFKGKAWKDVFAEDARAQKLFADPQTSLLASIGIVQQPELLAAYMGREWADAQQQGQPGLAQQGPQGQAAPTAAAVNAGAERGVPSPSPLAPAVAPPPPMTGGPTHG